MAFLNSTSVECCTNELDAFSVPMTQTAIESSSMVEYRPISTLSSDGPIEFIIPGETNEYIHPAYLYLYVRCKITRNDGSNLHELKDANENEPAIPEDIVAPVNNFLHSLFTQVDVSLNDKLITSSSGPYAMRAYIETLFNYSIDASKTHLTCSLWHKDTAGKFNTLNVENEGFRIRSNYVKKSNEFDMFGRIHTDITGLERILPNKVGVRIKLHRSKDEFCLMANSDASFKVALQEVILYARRIEISADLSLQINSRMNHETAKLPLTRVETRTHTIPKDIKSYTIDNLFLGNVPKCIVIGFISNKAFNGKYDKNPFHFETFNLNNLQVHVGSKSYPNVPLTPDFDKKLYVRSFYTLFSGTGIFYQNAGHTITREEYPNGYCLYSFILSPTNSLDDTTWDIVRDSPVNIKLGFAEPLNESITCIIYAQFDSLIQIDKDRKIYSDYTF